MSTTTRQLTELERAVRRARHVLRNPAANPTLAAKYVAPLLAEFDRREDEIERLRVERDGVLALTAEWEREANAGWPTKGNLMGYELHQITGEQDACRAHAVEVREALGGAS